MAERSGLLQKVKKALVPSAGLALPDKWKDAKVAKSKKQMQKHEWVSVIRVFLFVEGDIDLVSWSFCYLRTLLCSYVRVCGVMNAME